jgi:hypothetical protein
MAGRQTRRSARDFLKKTKIPGVEVCHPKHKSRKTKTCLSQDVVRKIQDKTGGKTETRKSLEVRLGCAAGDDVCLVEKSNLSAEDKSKIEKESFRPKTPSDWHGNMSTWLSDDDIRQVMGQYEEAYPEFKFLEVAPIDFSAQDPYVKDKKKCIAESFCKVDFASISEQGKKYLGAIFNLDPSYKSGSHWVGMFINIPKKEVNYFDSYGMDPPKQIAHFMKSLTLQDKSLKLQNSGRRFQYKGSECGMYSMIFILSMLNGESFRHFCRNPIPDSQAQRFREFLYR